MKLLITIALIAVALLATAMYYGLPTPEDMAKWWKEWTGDDQP
jgi:ABC-type multidrug transport system permease subunit